MPAQIGSREMTDITKINLMDHLQELLQKASIELKQKDKVRPEPNSYEVGFDDGWDAGYTKALTDALEELTTMLASDREWLTHKIPNSLSGDDVPSQWPS